VGKVEKDLPEDSPKNPATIADNVGDNVGDVAGMSADLFGSFAESTCAALVISSDTLYGGVTTSPCAQFLSVLFYPLLLIAVGIVVCILVSTLSTHIMKVETMNRIESTLKVQLIGSTVILLGVTYAVCLFSFPENFHFVSDNAAFQGKSFQPWVPYLCSTLGLVSGMIIAAFTEYVTSHAYGPVRGLANSCKSGPASNVTLGLALGYMSTLVPSIFIAVTAFTANHFLGYYGVALSALGMLSNLPLSLAIDGYGPISDNAGGISEMAGMGEEVRDRTDALDAAGNTTAAIGKGFAIGSAALVSLSLFGGFLHNAGLDADASASSIALTKPEIFAGLLLGAMLPYVFSAFTIRSVGKAAMGMVEEVRRQIHNDPGILAGTSEPDYKACIRISTISSLREMIAPGCLVILPLSRSSSLPCCSDSHSAPRSSPVSSPELS
jgi:inorganic pyrophosphatase